MKREVLILLITLFLSSSAFADSSLVGYWKFDEGSGSSTTDSSGNGHTGTLVSSPTWSSDVPTITNYSDPYSLSFDGSTNYVNVGAFSHFRAATAITIAAWIKPSTINPTDGEGRILSVGSSNGALFQMITGGKLNVYISNAGNIRSADNAVVADTWQHVAMTWQASDGGVVMYVNGVSVGTGTVAVASVNYTAGEQTCIGRFPVFAAGNFPGKIDEVVAYTRVLTGDEVNVLYEEGVAPMRIRNAVLRDVEFN